MSVADFRQGSLQCILIERTIQAIGSDNVIDGALRLSFGEEPEPLLGEGEKPYFAIGPR
jgi:hypothetical protein